MARRLSVNRQHRARLQRAVGARIRALRAERRLSATELATRAGLSKQDVSKMELGVSGTTLERYEAVALALGVPLPSLFPASRAA